MRGYVREVINKIQRLKKKAKLKVEDQFFIFYHFDEKSEILHEIFTTHF